MKCNFLIDQDQLNQLKSELKTAPIPPKKLGKKEVIKEMGNELRDAYSSGQTIESLQQFFAPKGLKISRRELTEVLGLSAQKTKRPTSKKVANLPPELGKKVQPN